MEPRRVRIAGAALLVASLVPVWSVRFFPSQDGPSHLYNARLLTALLDPANVRLREYFEFNPGLHPNLLAHALLAALQAVVSALLAEKILLTLLVALLPLSLLRLLRAVERGRDVYALASLPFAYHHLLHRGFYSLSLGLSLCFFTLAFFWPRRMRPTWGGALGLNALLLLTYLAHFGPFAMALVGMAVACAFVPLAEGDGSRGERLRRAVRGGLPALPAGLLGVAYLLGGSDGFTKYVSAEKLRTIFFERMLLTSYTTWQEMLAPWLLGCLAAALIFTALGRMRRPVGILPRDAFLAFAALLVVLFFTLPRWLNDGGFVNDRVFLLFFLLAWVGMAPPPRRLAIALGAVLLACAAAHLGRLSWEYARLQPELRAVTAAVERIEPHSTVAYRQLARRSAAFERYPRYVDPFAHVDAWYGMGEDVVLFDNYETRFDYFPLRATPAPRVDPDYLVVWPLADEEPLPEDLRNHAILHHANGLALLQKRD
jgi:branched-subunit amino acid transport protein